MRKPRRARFGYPDINPATLLFITQELRRARVKHPSNEKNFELISHYQMLLIKELSDYKSGRSNAATVFTTALQIAVMAIRTAEEGIAGHPYKGNVPTDMPGPMGEYVAEKSERSPADANSDWSEFQRGQMDTLTERFTK